MRLLLLLTAAATAFAQPDTGAITITASRNVTAIPDQVQYTVTLRTEAYLEVSEVVARLTGTGITAADLSYVTGGGEFTEWTFNLVTPFSKMAETNATLARLQQSIRVFQSHSLSFRVTSQQTSTDATAQACPLTALVSDARREADRIATAAGIHVGPIVGLSEARSIPTLLERQGAFTATLTSSRLGSAGFAELLLPYFPPLPTYTACSLVVQFGLLP